MKNDDPDRLIEEWQAIKDGGHHTNSGIFLLALLGSAILGFICMAIIIASNLIAKP